MQHAIIGYGRMQQLTATTSHNEMNEWNGKQTQTEMNASKYENKNFNNRSNDE